MVRIKTVTKGRPTRLHRQRRASEVPSSPSSSSSSSFHDSSRSSSPTGEILTGGKADCLKFMHANRFNECSDDDLEASASNPTKLRTVTRKKRQGWELAAKIRTQEVCHWFDKTVSDNFPLVSLKNPYSLDP